VEGSLRIAVSFYGSHMGVLYIFLVYSNLT
jgi:hypothetical protein